MTKQLKDYFPMIQTRDEVLEAIKRNKILDIFESWKKEQQEELLDFCTGARGLKILYDFIFKELFSPEFHPERIERFLSTILQRNVRIAQVLPNDSVRLADEGSLLITDIIVELDDGSLANIEMQKIGYSFPGERAACYSADMLLRQYKRVRARQKQKFTYRDIKTVYTIVLFEKSSKEFHALKEYYVHRGEQPFDTGLKINTLQEYILIPLDIFGENMHNKAIGNELDAWLTFLSIDEPEKIMELIEAYPEFKCMYDELYQLCLNIEGVMEMFSRELLELDRNTVQYMIEEQEKELEELQKRVEAQRLEADKQKREIEEQKQIAEEQKRMAEEQKQRAEEQKRIAEEQKRIAEEQKRMAEEQKRIAEEQKQVAEEKVLEEKHKSQKQEAEIKKLKKILAELKILDK